MVELIPRKQRKPVFGPAFFLIVSVVLAVGVSIGFFILKQLEADTRTALETIEKTLTEDTRPQEIQLETVLLEYKLKVEDLQGVLEKRKDFLSFFTFLEETVHPDIFFTGLESDMSKNQVSLEGEAADFVVLEQQRLVWSERGELQDFRLEDLEITSKGTGGFRVEFSFKRSFFKPS